MPEEAIQFVILMSGVVLFGYEGRRTGRYQRLLYYLPVPLVWLVVGLLRIWQPEFWVSDQAVVPTITLVAVMVCYGVYAVIRMRRLQ